MNIEKIKESIVRAEGYAQGFKDGFISCAQTVVNEAAKEEAEKNKKEEQNNG